MPAVAITDSGNLFGALEFATTCSAAGVQPIIGCEVALQRGDPEGGSRLGRALSEPDRIVLLVQNEAGYLNLLRLVSKSFLEGEPGEAPQLALGALAGNSDGLIAFTGGLHGAVPNETGWTSLGRDHCFPLPFRYYELTL